jgi:hypothetical protein
MYEIDGMCVANLPRELVLMDRRCWGGRYALQLQANVSHSPRLSKYKKSLEQLDQASFSLA